MVGKNAFDVFLLPRTSALVAVLPLLFVLIAWGPVLESAALRTWLSHGLLALA